MMKIDSEKEPVLHSTIDKMIRTHYQGLESKNLQEQYEWDPVDRQKLYSFLNGLPVFVFTKTLDHSIRFANSYFKKCFGDPSKKRCYELLRKRKEPCEECTTSQVFLTKIPQEWTCSQLADDHVYRIYDYPFIDDDGSFLVLEMGIDISDLIKAENTLKQNQDHLKKLVEKQTCELIRINQQLQEEINERMMVEDTLRAERDIAKKYLDLAGTMLVAINADQTVTLINKKGCEILGHREEEVLGKNWFDHFLPQNTYKQVKKIFDKLISGEMEQGEYFENLIVTKKGEERIIAWHNTFLKDKEGKIFSTLSSGEDITERKRAEKALIDQEQRFRTLAENAPFGISIMTIDRNFEYLNPKFKELFGYTIEDIPDKDTWFQKAYPDEEYRKKVIQIWQNDSNSTTKIGESEPRNFTVRCKNAQDKIIKFKAVSLENRKQLMTYEDITSQVMTENALRKSETRFRDIAYSIADFIWETDQLGRITYCSERIKDILGFRPDELIGKTFCDFMVPDDSKIIKEDFSELMKNRKPVRDIEHWVVKKNGTRCNLICSGLPIIDEQGNFKGYRGVNKDITEKKKMEKELERIDKLESIGILAGGIAHDFNNILTGILGNISLAKLTCSDPKTIELLLDTERATIRSKDLTQQLLTFAKGGSPIKKPSFIINLIKHTTDFALRGSKVTCDYFFPSENWPVEIDEGQVSQVLNNIIINSIQAMPEGGKITVHLENLTITNEDFLPRLQGKYVKISITDEGHGIPQSNLEKIFDPYFTTKQQGSGLGLAIAHSIIKKHGGHITVKSSLGIGTTFSIYLPASKKQPLSDIISVSEPLHGNGKILIVDDEEIVRVIASKMLETLGYTTKAVENTANALNEYHKERVAHSPFDVVILDLTIPGSIGGREAIKKFLEIDPKAKVIISSGYSNDPIMAYPQQFGFKGVLSKPYHIEELGTVLHQVKNQ